MSEHDDKQSKYYDRYAKALSGDQPETSGDNRPRRNRALIAGGTVVGLAVVGGGLWALLHGSGDGPAAASSTSVSTSQTSTSSPNPSSPGSSTSEPSPTSSAASASGSAPVVKAPGGWKVAQSNLIARDHLNYAVPADWTVRSKGYVTAWGSGASDPNLTGGHAVADKGTGSCSADTTYAPGVTAVFGPFSDPRPQSAARAFALKLASAVSEDSSGKPAAAIPTPAESAVTIAGGKTARKATITLPLQGAKCGSKTAKITVVAADIGAGNNASVWMAVTDPKSKDVTDADIDKIIATITTTS